MKNENRDVIIRITLDELTTATLAIDWQATEFEAAGNPEAIEMARKIREVNNKILKVMRYADDNKDGLSLS